MNELSEDPAERSRKYIATFEKALQEVIPEKEDSMVKAQGIIRISETIEHYLKDAHYYLEHNKPSTSLAAIAYAEGLLDALKFLALVEMRSSQ
jgi:FAD synthetase